MGAGVDRRVLRLVGEVMGPLDMDELCEGLLFALREAIPADFCAMNEVPGDIEDAISISDPPMSEAEHRAWAKYGHQNPLADHFMRSRDGRPTRFSDLLTRRELHRLEIYTEIYAPLGVEDQIAFMLPSRTRRVLGVALSRTRRDFTAVERDLLGVARPYLIQAYRNARAFSDVCRADGLPSPITELRDLGLTRRQAEVLGLVAMGRSDRHAAEALGIGIRTVQKHLEHGGLAAPAGGAATASATGLAGWIRANLASHHPTPLGDPPVPGEAEFLEQVFRAGVKVRASLWLAVLDLFRVGLYESATGRLDGREGAAHGCSGDPAATMTLPREDATDPPIR